MRYGEWFNLQDLLDTSMNRDSTAGAALGTPSPPSMAGSNFSWCLLLVLAVGAPLEPGLPPGCPRREWLGSGRGNYPDTCDGCGLTEVDFRRLKVNGYEEGNVGEPFDVCESCRYTACADCVIHHSKGTCY